MARYFFHIEDGSCIEDQQGVELESLDDVRAAALRSLSEALVALPDFWNTGQLRVICRNQAGLTLFTLETFLNGSPALQTSD